MYNGNITDNKVAGTGDRVNGGGVAIVDGVFLMHNGMISENVAHTGGGVALSRSSFTMNDGVITQNSAINHIQGAGGIRILSSNVVIYAGEISMNDAGTGFGGGISLETNIFAGPPLLLMLGGTVSGNRANYGGGVFMASGDLIMAGGIVYGSEETGVDSTLSNSVRFLGAALYLYSRANANYGDFSDILPHTEGELGFTDYTIIGRYANDFLPNLNP